MPIYQIHTIASAPEKSKPVLEQLQQAFGVIPNLVAAISNSPKLVTAFAAVFQQVHSSSLTEQEIQIVLLTDAVTNSCAYAVAFHTSLALKEGVSSEETDAIRARLSRGSSDLADFPPWRRRSSRNGAPERTGTRCIPCRRLHQGTDPGGHRHSRGLYDHQLCWNHRQSSAGRSVPAVRLARITTEDRNPGGGWLRQAHPFLTRGRSKWQHNLLPQFLSSESCYVTGDTSAAKASSISHSIQASRSVI